MSGDNDDRKKWVPSPPTLPAGPAAGRPLPPRIDEPLRGRIDTRRGFDPLARTTTPPIDDEGDFEGDDPPTTAEPIVESHPRLNANGGAVGLPADDAFGDDAQPTMIDPHVMDPVQPPKLEPIGGPDSGRGTVDLGDERDAYMASAYVRAEEYQSSSVIEPPPPALRSASGTPHTPPPLAEPFDKDPGQDEFLPVTVRGKRSASMDVARGSEAAVEPMARGSSEAPTHDRAPMDAPLRPPARSPTAPPPLPKVVSARSGTTKPPPVPGSTAPPPRSTGTTVPPPLPRSTGTTKPPAFGLTSPVTTPGAGTPPVLSGSGPSGVHPVPASTSGARVMPQPPFAGPVEPPSLAIAPSRLSPANTLLDGSAASVPPLNTLPLVANHGPQPTTLPGRPNPMSTTIPEAPLFLPTDSLPGALVAQAQAPGNELRVISMKTPHSGDSDKLARQLPKVEIRNVSDVARMPPRGPVGRLAPPRDARDSRSRRMQDLVIWGSVVVITASLVTLLIWFVAR